jgi:hypothetical protein
MCTDALKTDQKYRKGNKGVISSKRAYELEYHRRSEGHFISGGGTLFEGSLDPWLLIEGSLK